jgi:hypothetical protein
MGTYGGEGGINSSSRKEKLSYAGFQININAAEKKMRGWFAYEN